MQNLKPLSAVALLFVLLICGCTFTSSFSNRENDKKDAEKITAQFFADVKKQDTTSLYALFSKDFYAAASKDKLNEILNASQKKLGDVVTTKIKDWETKVTVGTVHSGEYKFDYSVHRLKYDSDEVFILQLDNDGKIRILNYNVQSEGFLK